MSVDILQGLRSTNAQTLAKGKQAKSISTKKSSKSNNKNVDNPDSG